MAGDVFFSYRNRDFQVVDRLYAGLRTVGVVYLSAADHSPGPTSRDNPPVALPSKGGLAMLPPLFSYQ